MLHLTRFTGQTLIAQPPEGAVRVTVWAVSLAQNSVELRIQAPAAVYTPDPVATITVGQEAGIETSAGMISFALLGLAKNGEARIGINAPRSVRVDREEVYLERQQETENGHGKHPHGNRRQHRR